MTDSVSQLQDIRHRAAEVAKAQAKREADKDRIQEALKETVKALKEEFGVSTVAEGEELLKKLKSELQSETEELRNKLKEAVG